MADGKDHVRVELTFHKTLPTLPVYKKRTESRRQPAPSAGEWPGQPTAARRPPPPTIRPTPPARRQPPSQEKETLPPLTQIHPDTTRSTITHDRTQKTAIIEPAPIITREELREGKSYGLHRNTVAQLPRKCDDAAGTIPLVRLVPAGFKQWSIRTWVRTPNK